MSDQLQQMFRQKSAVRVCLRSQSGMTSTQFQSKQQCQCYRVIVRLFLVTFFQENFMSLAYFICSLLLPFQPNDIFQENIMSLACFKRTLSPAYFIFSRWLPFAHSSCEQSDTETYSIYPDALSTTVPRPTCYHYTLQLARKTFLGNL